MVGKENAQIACHSPLFVILPEVMKRILLLLLLTFIVLVTGCRPSVTVPDFEQTFTIWADIYGYKIGDIVLVDSQKEPELGDVVIFDFVVNGSSCNESGSPPSVARKIIGMPGDRVVFSQCSYEANGYTGQTMSKGCGGKYERSLSTTYAVMWGGEVYENIIGLELTVPEGEYLSDQFVGWGCPEGIKSSLGYPIQRPPDYTYFTIKQEAVKGVVLEKVGHFKGPL
ncbi:hypothetical protein ACFLU4_02040 [Chloroflexota bacterium]